MEHREAQYFDPFTQPDDGDQNIHRTYLTSVMRHVVDFDDEDQTAELRNVVDASETDVINHFTTLPRPYPAHARLRTSFPPRGHTGIVGVYPEEMGYDFNERQGVFRVNLRGYKDDPDEVNEDRYPHFKTDMARTIAEVVAWRMEQRTRSVDILSEYDSTGKTVTLRKDRLEPFPPRWDRWIRKYVTTEPVWAF